MFLEPILVLSVLIPENLAQIQTKSSRLVGVPEPAPPEEPGVCPDECRTHGGAAGLMEHRVSPSSWAGAPRWLCWRAGVTRGKPAGQANLHTFMTSTKLGPLPWTIQDTPDMGLLAMFAQTSQGLLLQLAGAGKATPAAP